MIGKMDEIALTVFATDMTIVFRFRMHVTDPMGAPFVSKTGLGKEFGNCQQRQTGKEAEARESEGGQGPERHCVCGVRGVFTFAKNEK